MKSADNSEPQNHTALPSNLGGNGVQLCVLLLVWNTLCLQLGYLVLPWHFKSLCESCCLFAAEMEAGSSSQTALHAMGLCSLQLLRRCGVSFSHPPLPKWFLPTYASGLVIHTFICITSVELHKSILNKCNLHTEHFNRRRTSAKGNQSECSLTSSERSGHNRQLWPRTSQASYISRCDSSQNDNTLPIKSNTTPTTHLYPIYPARGLPHLPWQWEWDSRACSRYASTFKLRLSAELSPAETSWCYEKQNADTFLWLDRECLEQCAPPELQKGAAGSKLRLLLQIAAFCTLLTRSSFWDLQISFP